MKLFQRQTELSLLFK